jgi:hypothetical protein
MGTARHEVATTTAGSTWAKEGPRTPRALLAAQCKGWRPLAGQFSAAHALRGRRRFQWRRALGRALRKGPHLLRALGPQLRAELRPEPLGVGARVRLDADREGHLVPVMVSTCDKEGGLL